MGKWLQVLKALWTSSQAIKGVAVVAAVAVVGTTTYVAAPYVFSGNSNETVIESETTQDVAMIDDEMTPGTNMQQDEADEPQNAEEIGNIASSDNKDRKAASGKSVSNRIKNEGLRKVIITEENTITEEVKEEITVEKEDKSSSDDKSENKKPQEDKPVVNSEYKLVWEDNFDAEKLNRDDWNVELHQPGWVNAEWQEYVDSEDNIYLKDGKLVLQAIKTTKDGKDYYTSGRVNTKDKHDFKYGKFEAKLKVPSGMGFLPAFWMMPTDEGFYGQWPKCGEIDIMEVMGQSTDTLHGTIHYGDPHGQKQGTYKLNSSKKDFAEAFHVFTCEWEPGRITWYVDGIKFHEANDWYTKRAGFDEAAYPAPFDQPFYMIFNVAVGGSWVGYPDETTKFDDNAQMVVDYVRVYQKDSYDENVTKPEKAEVPDSAIGENLLHNGEFTNSESFADGTDWEFLLANGGEGNAQIVKINDDNALKITTNNAGTVDYSVQLVQGPIALKQGNKYRVTFDAWADEVRTMKALISAPDLNYIRYWGDQTVSLTTEKKTFTYEFDMAQEGDANSRFEMTFGNMGSTAAVYIDNVKVEKVGTFEIPEEGKTVLPDGNFIYNSGFDTGSDRMKYWTVDSNITGVNYAVTNADGIREFKAVVPNTVSALTDVVLKQEDTAITGGKNYLFTFEAYGAEAKSVKAVIAPTTSGKEALEFDVDITTNRKEYSYSFTMPEGVNGADVEFLIGAAGTTYIDNVRVQEDANVINGNFTSGVAGWELYAYTPGDVTFAIDEKDNGSGTSAAALNIVKSGPVDWHIQLKQPVTLEQGKKYRVSFDAWSTVERDFVFAIQRNADKKGDSDWISYSGDINEAMSTTGFKHYSKEFDMTWVTDDIADLKFTLGAVNGKEIQTSHTVFIDNVVLEEIGTCEIQDGSEAAQPVNVCLSDISLVKVKDADGNENADSNNLASGNWSGPCTTEEGKIKALVTNPGADPWSVQLQQFGINLENGCEYKLTFNGSANTAKLIEVGLQNATNYSVYNVINNKNTVVQLSADEKSYTITFTMNSPTDANTTFYINLGNVTDGYLISPDGEQQEVPDEGEEVPSVPEIEGNMFECGSFSYDGNIWDIWNGYANAGEQASGNVSFENGQAIFDITNVGVNPWSIALQYNAPLTLEKGASYKLTFDVNSTEARIIKAQFMENDSIWFGGGDVTLTSGDTKAEINFTVENADTSSNVKFSVQLGEFGNTPASKLIIDNMVLLKVADAEPVEEVSVMSICDSTEDEEIMEETVETAVDSEETEESDVNTDTIADEAIVTETVAESSTKTEETEEESEEKDTEELQGDSEEGEKEASESLEEV